VHVLAAGDEHGVRTLPVYGGEDPIARGDGNGRQATSKKKKKKT
jgi:hypothetical protein